MNNNDIYNVYKITMYMKIHDYHFHPEKQHSWRKY